MLGEFGLQEVLKQFLGQDRADTLSAAWAGDRYALFEDPKTKETSLVFRLALDNTEDAARFFGQYSEFSNSSTKPVRRCFRRPNYFQFQSDVWRYLPAVRRERCLSVENTTRETYDKIDRACGLARRSCAFRGHTPETLSRNTARNSQIIAGALLVVQRNAC